MDNFARNIKIVSGIIVIMFISLLVYLANFMIKDSKKVENNVFNLRNSIKEEKVKRGDILDRTGQIIATTMKVNGKNHRIYKYGRIFSHVVGYDSKRFGKTGLELSYDKELMNYDSLKALKDNEKVGKTVQLTLSAEIQKAAYEALGDRKGAVVAINPKTGEILAMVSKPDYDPSTIDADWKTLASSQNNPFYNRATQGLYPPGSTFKVVTSSAAYKFWPGIESFTYTCIGQKVTNGYTLRCFNGEVHGNEGVQKAFAESCNTFFATVGINVGRKNLLDTANSFGFNKQIDFDIPLSKSTLEIDEYSKADLAQVSIGQARTLATPLQMVLVCETVANNGVMMKPHIISSIFRADGGILNNKTFTEDKVNLEELGRPISSQIAERIKTMMKDVVNYGTGTSAAIEGVEVAGKTGTAEGTDSVTHAWFIGFAPASDPKIAVAVVVEKADGTGGTTAAPIARSVIEKAINLKY